MKIIRTCRHAWQFQTVKRCTVQVLSLVDRYQLGSKARSQQVQKLGAVFTSLYMSVDTLAARGGSS
jgi:hypothetical protein